MSQLNTVIRMVNTLLRAISAFQRSRKIKNVAS